MLFRSGVVNALAVHGDVGDQSIALFDHEG